MLKDGRHTILSLNSFLKTGNLFRMIGVIELLHENEFHPGLSTIPSPLPNRKSLRRL